MTLALTKLQAVRFTLDVHLRRLFGKPMVCTCCSGRYRWTIRREQNLSPCPFCGNYAWHDESVGVYWKSFLGF